MNVLVSGGTGFIGSAIVEEAKRSGRHHILTLSRHGQRKADVTDRPSLKGVLKDIDVLIHCVQFPNHPVENPRKGYTYEKFDGEGTENICDEVRESSVRRIIYVSGAGTDDTRREPWFKAKARAEKAVKATGREYVILRPSWVYGPGDQSLNKLIGFAKHLPAIPVIGNGQGRVSPVFIEDLAKICVSAITEPTDAHEVFEVGGPETLTMNEVLRKVLKLIGKNKPLIHQPLWFMRAAGTVMQNILPKAPLSKGAVDFLNMDLPVDGGKVEKLYGMKFKNLESALRTYI